MHHRFVATPESQPRTGWGSCLSEKTRFDHDLKKAPENKK
jgi:hypothetical protein